MMDESSMINRALKLTREFHRIKQSELAERLSVSKSFLSEVESGKKAPTLDLLQRYADAFGIPASTLLLFAERLKSGDTRFRRNGKVEKVMQFLEWVVSEERAASGSP
jgi:transcriptional regulator with XRE-family HTH domain